MAIRSAERDDEILKYKPVCNPKEDDDSFSSLWKRDKPEPKEYTDETIRYLETKEKSVGDTIRFSGDIKSAIKGIIQSFGDNPALLKYSEDHHVQDISELRTKYDTLNELTVIELLYCGYFGAGNNVNWSWLNNNNCWPGGHPMTLRFSRDQFDKIMKEGNVDVSNVIID